VVEKDKSEEVVKERKIKEIRNKAKQEISEAKKAQLKQKPHLSTRKSFIDS
jgi:hypothetical protein